MRFKKETYLKYWSGFGDRDIDIRCNTKKIVKVRKEHDCMMATLVGNKHHTIKPGEYALVDTALVDRDFWGHAYLCLKCLDKHLIEDCGILDGICTPLDERDYSDLEGNTINYIDERRGFKSRYKTKGKIVGIEYDLGITIERNGYLLCCIHADNNFTTQYKALFFSAINMIKKGYFDMDKMYKIMKALEINVNISKQDELELSCPFNQ